MNKETFQYGKNVLITGASRGIGLATARLLSNSGFSVLALARHKGPEIPNVTWIEADVTDCMTLNKALSPIKKLGIVIHCAGMGISGSAELVPEEAAKRQMEVNYFGVLNVNRLILSKLRQNKKSLVIITSSVAGILPIPFQSHYSSSKYALEAYGEALAMEGKHFGIRVCLVEPGDTHTSFTTSRTHDEPKNSPYLKLCNNAVGKMENDEQNGKNPDSVARVFLKQISKRKPKIRVAVGLSYKLIAALARVLPYRFRQKIISLLYLSA